MKHELIFGGVNLSDYGVWISGEGTFNAPSRSFEMVSVPGRNGNLIIDNGKWENIVVTYPAYIESGFRCKFSDFRMMMCNMTGYQTLEDTYHPNEYRQAVFVNGFTVETGQFNKSGRFEISFNCKPQRFLKSGTIPALELTSSTTPQHILAEGKGKDIFYSSFKTSNTWANTDTEYTIIDLTSVSATVTFKLWYSKEILGTLFIVGSCWDNPTTTDGNAITSIQHYWDEPYYTFDVDASVLTDYAFFPTPIRWEVWNGTTLFDANFPTSEKIFNPTGYEAKPIIHLSLSSAVTDKVVALVNDSQIKITSPTYNILPNTGGKQMTDVYIDCETMNAYMPIGNAYYNLNPYVTIPREIISLTAGDNDVYVNGYIDSIEIIPRWWKL